MKEDNTPKTKQEEKVTVKVKEQKIVTSTSTSEETAEGNWEDFEEITKGDFKRLLGCG